MRKAGVCWAGLLLLEALSGGCSQESGGLGAIDGGGNGGEDAGSCPEREVDAGAVQLTRRGCPLRIEYAIR